MKNRFLFFLFAIVGCAVVSCKKDYPAPSSSEPEFTFKGTVDGNAVNLQSGVNSYYMFTFYSLDGNGAYDFAGELKDKNCSSNCANSLKISIKDYRPYAGNPTSIDTSIVRGYYSFATPSGTPTKYYVTFSDTLYHATAQTYQWEFGDGTTSNQHNPAHLYLHPGVYNVKLTINTGVCLAYLSNDIVLGQSGNAFSVPFYQSFATGTTIHYGGSISGVHPVIWIVDFGDGSSTTGTGWSHTYANEGFYNASLSVTDATGYTAVKHINAETQNEVLCRNDFNLTDTIIAVNPGNFSDVTIEWKDANGNLFTSVNDSQPSTSMFKIISVENFLANSIGQPTKKIKAKISCALFNGTTRIVLTGDVAFSVAHL